MASEHVSDAAQTKPLEEKIADLNLQEKAGLVTEGAREYLDGAKDAAIITGEQVKKDINENVAKASEQAPKEGEEQPQDLSSREVKIAKEEVQQSPDDGAYAVPAVDHRSVTEPSGEEKKLDVPTAVVHENADHRSVTDLSGEEKVDVPTAVVHENADPVEMPQQQGKGLIQSVTGKITNSVKSVFSSFTGGKAGKNAEPKIKGTPE